MQDEPETPASESLNWLDAVEERKAVITAKLRTGTTIATGRAKMLRRLQAGIVISAGPR